MADPRSANGRALVAAGYTPGTRAYDSQMRNLQRATTEAGQRRAPQAATLARLAPAEVQRIQAAKAVRDAGGVRGAVGKRVTIIARIEGDRSPFERQRARTFRQVQSVPLTPDQAARLRDDPGAFLSVEFNGSPGGTDGLGAIIHEMRSISIR